MSGEPVGVPVPEMVSGAQTSWLISGDEGHDKRVEDEDDKAGGE